MPNNSIAREFPVRYGRTYKVVLALTLPSLLIIPFILVLSRFKDLPEWQIWTFIILILGSVIGLSLWLVSNVYPKAIISIGKQEINLVFNKEKLLSPSDFSFMVSDIVNFKAGAIGSGNYYNFETQNPRRKFQISALSYEEGDLIAFDEAISLIDELVNHP